MDSLNIGLKIDILLNNGECLEIVKREKDFIDGHIKSMRKDKDTKFNHMKEKIHLFQAYDRLIEVFENHLAHETP